jgi:hypothetical protein
MTDTTENSAMFSLGALVRSAPTVAAEPEEAPQTSLRDARFVPVLAAPVAVEPPRVGAWVLAAGLVAMLAPIAAMAFYVTRTSAPVRASTTTATVTATATATPTATETVTATATVTTTVTATAADAPRAEPHVHHAPRTTTITTATTTARPREAPKCCPGETEIACAMRRSVGAACGA